jgi:selenocysteine-specific elongation factor
VIQVSVRSETGLDRLRNELSRLAANFEPRRSDAPFRLPVDRVFTRPGFGTVVTGTLLSGTISVGEEVEILPEGISARIRGIQAHGTSRETGGAGERLAVNLQGIEHFSVHRGDVVVPIPTFLRHQAS